FESFQDLTEDMQREIVRTLLNVQIRRVEPAAADGQPPSEAAAQAAAPASPRADRPGAVTNGEQVPPARPAAAAASGALARVTTPARAGLPLPAQPAVRNIVESSSAGTRRADGAASGARAMPGNGKPGKVGRNQPCPCGSGKKYKYRHGRPRSCPGGEGAIRPSRYAVGDGSVDVVAHENQLMMPRSIDRMHRYLRGWQREDQPSTPRVH